MTTKELIIEYKKLGFGKPFKTWDNTIDDSYYSNNIIGLVQFLAAKYHMIVCAMNEEERLNQVEAFLKLCQNKKS